MGWGGYGKGMVRVVQKKQTSIVLNTAENTFRIEIAIEQILFILCGENILIFIDIISSFTI